MLHGGPGGGCTPSHRRQFDPEAYRIVLFDQRNCGRSLPPASDPSVSLERQHDLAPGRRHRAAARAPGIERWQVFGGSWGSALALAYAQTHPERVTEMVLRGIFTLRPFELYWFYQEGASLLFPDLWEEYVAPIPEDERDDLIAAFHTRLNDPDPARAAAGGAGVERLGGLDDHAAARDEVIGEHSDDDYAVTFARIENHYFVHGGILRGRPAHPGRRPDPPHPVRDRPGPLRRVHPGGDRLGPAPRLAGGGVPPGAPTPATRTPSRASCTTDRGDGPLRPLEPAPP